MPFQTVLTYALYFPTSKRSNTRTSNAQSVSFRVRRSSR